MNKVTQKTSTSKRVARDRRILAEARREDGGKPVSEVMAPALVQVVPGDLQDGVRELQSVFDDLIDAEFVGQGSQRDAIVFGALKRVQYVRNILSMYAGSVSL